MHDQDPAFTDLVDVFLADLFARDPVFATTIGHHAHDDRWPDLGPEGLAARAAFDDRWLARFRGLTGLTRDEAIDRDLLVGELEADRFEITESRGLTWDPLDWIYLVGTGLLTLNEREFAPLADRLASSAGRLERLPALVDDAVATIGSAPERQVSRLHTETALTALPGIVSLVAETLDAAEATRTFDPAVEAIIPRLEAAAAVARSAMARFESHLREVILPASAGEGRLGAERFVARLRHTLRSDELTPAYILARAEREYAAVRAEMVRLATELWPVWCGERPRPDDEGALVRRVLDAIALEHPVDDERIAFCVAEDARIEAFCEARDLIGMADEPLAIEWTPAFLRSSAGAMLWAPGPLDKGQKTVFAITPMPDSWTPEQRESNLREDNDRMLRLLCIHEAVPGHYLQAVYANRCPSMVRSIFASGVFAEGWAVYATQVMMDAGYGSDDPALLLTHWKFYLRSVTNAIIDVRIHAGEAFGGPMTEAEALDLMVDGGFQEAAEARAKWDRARLTSTQLSTYFVGSLAMWDLEVEVRRRLAEASDDPRGRAAVVVGDLPGGLGETPGFVYRPHLEAVIGHGAPPIPLLRRILLGDA